MAYISFSYLHYTNILTNVLLCHNCTASLIHFTQQVNPTRKLHHLQALTFITAVGCAVSIVSCAVLFVSLCWKRSFVLLQWEICVVSKDNDNNTVCFERFVNVFFLC